MAVTPLYTAEQISERIKALAAELRASAGAEEVFLLGILNGSSVFLADLLRALEGDVSYGFIDVVRDVADTSTASALQIDFVSYTNIAGRNVYVLKDVVTTGAIETYLLAQLRSHRPKTIHLVALIDRPELRTMDLQADFRAFEVDGGEGTFFGYGLELGGRSGNLPFLGRT